MNMTGVSEAQIMAVLPQMEGGLPTPELSANTAFGTKLGRKACVCRPGPIQRVKGRMPLLHPTKPD
jgi:hypothetical protein